MMKSKYAKNHFKFKRAKEKLDEHIYSENRNFTKSIVKHEMKQKSYKAKLVGESHQHLNVAHKMAKR